MKKYFTVVGITLVAIFFSERLFWGNFRPMEDTFESFFWLALFYYLLSFTFLYCVSGYKQLNKYNVFILGLIFALLAEGVVAGLLFANPVSFLFSQPYHTIVTVLFGFVVLPRLLTKWHPFAIVLLMFIAGLAHGLWSFGWVALEPESMLSFSNYMPHIFISTALLIIGYSVLAKFSGDFTRYFFTKTEVAVSVLLLIGISFLNYGVYALITLPLIGICVYLLQRLASSGDKNDGPEEGMSLPIAIPSSRLILLMIFPCASSLSAWYWYNVYKVPFEIQYIFLVPLTLYFFYRLYRIVFLRTW